MDLQASSLAGTVEVSGNTFPGGLAAKFGLSGTLTGPATLGALQGDATYLLTSTLTVNAGGVLTIPPGVHLRGANREIRVNAGGVLNAEGTSAAARDVVFTETYVTFATGGAGTVKNCVFQWPAGGCCRGAISITDASPVIMGNEIRGSLRGIDVGGSSQAVPAAPTIDGNTLEGLTDAIDIGGTARAVVAGNTFRSNATSVSLRNAASASTVINNLFERNTSSIEFDQIATVFGAFPLGFADNDFVGLAEENLIQLPSNVTLTQAGTIPAAKVPYRLSGLTVNAGVNLSLEPGTVLKNASFSRIVVNGQLLAGGTSDHPIVFTAQTPKDGTRWRGLQLNNQMATGPSFLDSAIVEFGGAAGDAAIRLDRSSIILTRTVVSNNTSDGIQITNNAAPEISQTTVTTNGGDGISVGSGATPHIADSSIVGNASVGVRSEDCATFPMQIAAEDVYWGHDSGPVDSSDDRSTGGLFNPSGLGDDVTNCVDYEPWVRLAPSVAGQIVAVSGMGQTGPAGSILPEPLCVLIQGMAGSPLADIDVTFSVSQGAGTIETPQPLRSAANGLACAELRLGPMPGPNGVAVTARDVDAPLVSFAGDGTASSFAAFASSRRVRPGSGGRGDVNGDGRTNVLDAAIMEAVHVERLQANEGPARFYEAHGDVNGDGDVDAGDQQIAVAFSVRSARSVDRKVQTTRRVRAHLRQPRTIAVAGDVFPVEVEMRHRGEGASAYVLEVYFDRNVLEVVDIQGGTAPGFTQPPLSRVGTYRSGRVRFAAVNEGLKRLPRRARIATIYFRVIGMAGDETQIELRSTKRSVVALQREFETRQLDVGPPVRVELPRDAP